MDWIPDWLPPSATTDITLLLRDAKPAVRLHVGHRRGDLRRWARRVGLFTSVDADGYAAISRNPAIARRVIDLDRRPGRHTLALGTMLGYPVCCSRAAARVGDEGIDDRHQVVSACGFQGLFSAINPSGYIEGTSRISHVPCSHRCKPSLAIANAWKNADLRRYVVLRRGHPSRERCRVARIRQTDGRVLMDRHPLTR